jgi:23S rRNA (pseudouridine1915-N3)-methyltransferase
MYRIKIFSIGKTKESWLQEAIDEYEKRLRSIMLIEWFFAKNNEQLKAFLAKEHSWVSLSPQAKQYTSEQFSSFLYKLMEDSGARACFVIGGAEGLPPDILAQSRASLSLSSLTFTHQMTRLILLEQIYRATEIQKGSDYHK